MRYITEINEHKEGLRRLEAETESFKRCLAETKRLCPIEETRILPAGTVLLALALLCGLGTFWAVVNHSGGLFLVLNTILALALAYYGFLLLSLGLRFRRMNRQSRVILARAERIKAELEREIAERQ